MILVKVTEIRFTIFRYIWILDLISSCVRFEKMGINDRPANTNNNWKLFDSHSSELCFEIFSLLAAIIKISSLYARQFIVFFYGLQFDVFFCSSCLVHQSHTEYVIIFQLFPFVAEPPTEISVGSKIKLRFVIQTYLLSW